MKIMFLAFLMSLTSFVHAQSDSINSGDLIKVSVFGNQDLSLETKVTESGHINYPLIGNIKVAGLNYIDAQNKIAKLLEDNGFLNNPSVNVLIMQSVSQQISLLGKIHSPGKYNIQAGAKSLFDFLSLAGGTVNGASNTVTIVRTVDGTLERINVNIEETLLNAQKSQINDLKLNMQPGDIVYVPEAPVYYVYGESRSPGKYPLKDGIIMVQALSASGGLSPKGTLNDLKITRYLPEKGYTDVSADLSTLIMPNDIIIIKESFF